MASSPLVVIAKFNNFETAFLVLIDKTGISIILEEYNEEISTRISPQDDCSSTNEVTTCPCLEMSSQPAKFNLNPIVFGALLSEISNSRLYRSYFLSNMQNCIVIAQLQGPWIVPIDHEWNRKIAINVREMAELDNLMAILSTLGGGYSSLGDKMQECAKIAGKISQKQMRIAVRLGDPTLIARCKVYMAISLLQQGNLRMAKRIIMDINEFANSLPGHLKDPRLKKMCLGVWAKLQYAYQQRHLAATRINNSKLCISAQ